MRLLALGMRQPLAHVPGKLARLTGEARLTLVGDAAQEWLSADGSGSLAHDPGSSVQRARMGVELSRRMTNGLEPFGELSGRYA